MELPLPGHVSRNYPGKSGTDSNYVSASPSCLSQLSGYISKFSSGITAHVQISLTSRCLNNVEKIELSTFSIYRVRLTIFFFLSTDGSREIKLN